jgi:UDP-N-acetylmuramoyl-tripeptide--D-alanyl-D-alanine ligase
MEYLLLDRGITLIQDYYNANPTATKEALESVASISEGRLKIAVLGDMLELGHDSVYYHKEIGRVVASLSYDILIAYGEFGQYISEGAHEQGMRKDQIYYFNKEEESKLVNWLIKSAPEYSIILLKGSRKMQMENIVQFWKENIKLKGNINDN